MEVSLTPESKCGMPLQITSYSSYRLYIRDFYNFKKNLKSGYSYRLFAKRAGILSPNYLQLVIQGKRNLSEKLGLQVAKAMGLSNGERSYFIALIQKENSDSPEGLREAEKNMYVAIKHLMSKEIPKAALEVISDWHPMVIREMVFLHDFQPEGDWISKRLNNLITSGQAEQSLKLLIRAGFLRVLKNGKLGVSDPVVDTGDEFNFLRVLEYHCANFDVWKKLLQALSSEDRELGLISIALPTNKIPELKKRIRKFQDEIMGWAGEIQEMAKIDKTQNKLNSVVQVGCYLIPLTQNELNH